MSVLGFFISLLSTKGQHPGWDTQKQRAYSDQESGFVSALPGRNKMRMSGIRMPRRRTENVCSCKNVSSEGQHQQALQRNDASDTTLPPLV